MGARAGLCVIALFGVFSAAVWAVEEDYFAIGGDLTLPLRPPALTAITNLLWKHNGDLLAEWVQGEVPLTYYGNYKGRTKLDTTTGLLRLTNMTQADTGTYTVEINSKLQDKTYSPKVAQGLTEKPLIRPQPVSCGLTKESCTLVCDGPTEKKGPITYAWRRSEEGEWEATPAEELEIVKSNVKKFRCRMRNLVNELESDAIDNPLYVEPFNLGAVVGGVIAVVVAVLVGAGVAYWKRKELGEMLGFNKTDGGDGPAPGGGAGKQPEEGVPLNGATSEGGPGPV